MPELHSFQDRDREAYFLGGALKPAAEMAKLAIGNLVQALENAQLFIEDTAAGTTSMEILVLNDEMHKAEELATRLADQLRMQVDANSSTSGEAETATLTTNNT